MNKKRPSKLIFILGEYIVFSFLCSFATILFLIWASGVITENYIDATNAYVDMATRYALNTITFSAGVFMFVFSLAVLLRNKFSYMIEISNAVEEMESGNLSKRIDIKGNDELTDLAVSINKFAQTMEDNIALSNRLKEEQFNTVASLSHDIRTPLTSVMSYLQFIRDGNYKDDIQLKSYVDKAYEKSYRIKEMSDQLFESCKSHEEIKTVKEKVNCKNFIEQFFFEIEDYLENSGFETSMFVDDNCKNYIMYVNTESIPRVFDNILSNIEKYADKNFPVIFSADVKENTLYVIQKNTSVSHSEKRDIESNLLGLNNVKKVLSEVNGNMSVWEENNVFSLEITIPLYKSTENL